MNERIQKLKQQAQEFYIGYPDSIYNELVDQKFAELLIRECAATAWWAEQYDMGNGKPISKQIKEHFGVEE